VSELERCQQKLKNLLLIGRLGVCALVLVTGAQCVYALWHAAKFRHMFEDMRIDVRPTTAFFTGNGMLIGIAAVVLGGLAIATMCARPSRLWPIAVGLAVAVALHTTAQLAQEAMLLPLLDLMQAIGPQ
jgi:hypothetical protein